MISDLRRVAVARVIVTFLLLALFLRALVAPLLLLLGSAARLRGVVRPRPRCCSRSLGGGDFVHYVPLVAAVLLVGSARTTTSSSPAASARRRAAAGCARRSPSARPSASRAITVAGITLAATFALLALVPLRPFRELALLMTIGVLLDALFVRPVLIPALLAVAGRFAWWPGAPQRRGSTRATSSRRVARAPGAAEAGSSTLATLTTLGRAAPRARGARARRSSPPSSPVRCATRPEGPDTVPPRK